MRGMGLGYPVVPSIRISSRSEWLFLVPTKPLDLEKCGLEVVYLKSNSLLKRLKHAAEYSGPLFVHSSLEIPCREKIFFILLMTVVLDLSGRRSISTNFEK